MKTIFLRGILDETVYMQQPKEFIEEEGKVCLFKKSLYRLKQIEGSGIRNLMNF